VNNDRLARLIRVAGALISILAIAAGLTVDVPPAWSLWSNLLGNLPIYLLCASLLAFGLALLVPRERVRKSLVAIANRVPYRVRIVRTNLYPEPSAPRDGVNRFHELYAPVRAAFDAADFFLDERILGATAADHEQSFGLLRMLVRNHIYEPFLEMRNEIAAAMRDTRRMTDPQFRDLVTSLQQAMRQYNKVACWIQWLGEVYFGKNEWRSLPGYGELHSLHIDMLIELKRIEQRPDLGRVARNLPSLLKRLGPPLDDADSGTKSG
jgi:hypothetical protein